MSIASLFRSLFGIKKVKDVAALRAYIKEGDIAALANWIEYRIVYSKDRLPGDDWKSADAAIQDESGDCEDRAVVAWEVIRYWPGWQAELFVMTRPDASRPYGIAAHAICGATDLKTGRRYAVEGTRPYPFPRGTPWAYIFSVAGGWEKFWNVDEKGRRVP